MATESTIKLRIRLDGQTHVVIAPDTCNLATLKERVKEAIPHVDLGEQFELSLNKRDCIQGEETQSLQELSLRSGDLVFIINNTPTPALDVKRPKCHEDTTSPLTHQIEDLTQQTTHQSFGLDTDADKISVASARNNDTFGKEVHYATEQQTLPTGHTGEASTNGQIVNVSEIIQRATAGGVALVGQTGNGLTGRLIDLYASASPRSPGEALFICLHTLMLEAGFVPMGNNDMLQMPSNWKAVHHFGTSYTHTMLTEPHLVDMKCIIMGSTMCVCACVEKVQSDGNKTPGTVWTTNLRISDYVNGSHLSAGPAQVYRKLNVLALKFRNEISHRLLTDVRELAGFIDTTTLHGLLPELKLMILGYLPAKALCTLALVDRQFQALTSDPLLWKQLFLRVFGSPSATPVPRDYDWKKEYIRRAKIEKERKRFIFVPTAPYVPPMPGGYPDYGFPGPLFGGMLGGDYDRFPSPFAGNPFAPSAGMGMDLDPSVMLPRPGLRNMPPDMGNLGIPAPLGEPSLQQGRVPRGLGGIGRGIGGGGMMPRIL